MTAKKTSPIKKIRLHCLSCCGGSIKEVRCCPATNCELWDLRFGMSPKAFIRLRGKKGNNLLDKSNLEEGAQFDQEISANNALNSKKIWKE